MTLLVGLARRDITPPPGLPMDGYDAREQAANGVLDPLSVRTLYVARGERRACLVSLEVLGVDEAIVNRLQREIGAATNVPRDAVIIAATHTHAGPAGFATAAPRDTPASTYVDAALDAVVDAALEARRVASPCSLRFATHQAIGLASSRIDPERETDSHVRVFAFANGRDGTLQGLVVHFACHPTVLGEDNRRYTGDFVGRALLRIEETYRVPCLFLQGASADVSTRFTRTARNVGEADRLAAVLVAAVRDALRTARDVPRPDLAFDQAPLHLTRRTAPARAELEALVRASTEELGRVAGGGRDAGHTRRLQTRISGALHMLRTRDELASLGPVATTLTGLRLGDTILVTVPGELFRATALEIDGYGDAWLPVTLANGYLGYFPTATAIAAGEYESLYTTFDDTATAQVARGVRHLVATLRRDDPGPREGPL